MQKLISFIKEYEQELLEYANSKKNFSRWVKEKLREEMLENIKKNKSTDN
jgi:hypothetical protein